VQSLHHVHAWAIDENHNALEAHVVVDDGFGTEDDAVRRRIKALAHDRFGIRHTTLEIERPGMPCAEEGAQVIGHSVGPAVTAMPTATRHGNLTRARSWGL
jgi:cobalt-zinc-cadmium efflux system protein